MKFLKINMIIVWLFLVATQYIPALSFMAPQAFIALLVIPVIHTVEFFLYIPLLKKAPGTMVQHFIQVLLYGVIHYLDVKKYAEQTEA